MAEAKAAQPRTDYVAHYASIAKKYNLPAQVTSSFSYPQERIVRQTGAERQRKALAAAKRTVDLDNEAYAVDPAAEACPRPNPAYVDISTTEESYRKRLRSNADLSTTEESYRKRLQSNADLSTSEESYRTRLRSNAES